MAEELPQRLLRLLNERHYGKSETAWARESGVDFNTLRNTLSGKSTPRYPTMVKLADYCGVSYEYLLTGEGSSEPPPADRDAIKAKLAEIQRLVEELAQDVDAQDGKS